MTLIAAFRSQNFPVLLGDFLLTSGSSAVGFKKKVLRLSSNCALAWTGNLYRANKVFSDLRARFNSERTIYKEIAEYLTTYKIRDSDISLRINIIGWVIEDGEQYCFRWKSKVPTELELCEPCFDGTGAFLLEKYMPNNINANDGGSSLLEAKHECLTVAAELMGDEFIFKNYQRFFSFGHGYDILIYEENEFKYIDNITYTALKFNLDADGNVLNSQQSESFQKYLTQGEFSVTQTVSPKTGNSIEIIHPIGINKPQTAEMIKRSLRNNVVYSSARSKYYCLFISIESPDFYAFPTTLVISDHELPRRINANADDYESRISFQIPDSMVQIIFQQLRNNPSVFPNPRFRIKANFELLSN